MKFAGALLTQPNNDMWGIAPKKRANFPGNLNCVVNTKTLECLQIKNAVVESAFGAFVSVNTFPLTKDLFSHRIHHFFAPHRAKPEPLEIRRELSAKMSFQLGQATFFQSGEGDSQIALPLMMPLVYESVNILEHGWVLILRLGVILEFSVWRSSILIEGSPRAPRTFENLSNAKKIALVMILGLLYYTAQSLFLPLIDQTRLRILCIIVIWPYHNSHRRRC